MKVLGDDFVKSEMSGRSELWGYGGIPCSVHAIKNKLFSKDRALHVLKHHVASIAVNIHIGEVGPASEQAVRLEYTERKECFSGCNQRYDFQLCFTDFCRQGTLAFKVAGSHFNCKHGKEVMADGDLAGGSGLAIKVSRAAAVEIIKVETRNDPLPLAEGLTLPRFYNS